MPMHIRDVCINGILNWVDLISNNTRQYILIIKSYNDNTAIIVILLIRRLFTPDLDT